MEFIQELTEQSDARHKAMKLFQRMDKHLDALENMHDDLETGPGAKQMAAHGYGEGELRDLRKGLADTIEVFLDFMPGLEAEMRGEN